MKKDRNQDWRRGLAEGKETGARFRGQFGPVTTYRTSLDDLTSGLSDALVSVATGDASSADVDELRGLAVRHRAHDWSGATIGAATTLWKLFGDSASRSWLPVMLAEAGRFEEAAQLPVRRGQGGPPAYAEAVLATALSALGRDDEARKRTEELFETFPSLRERFVTTWGTDELSRQYAALRTQADSSALPVFFHLPFSGGTSMIVSLKRTIPWARMIEIQRRFGLLQIERALQYSAEELEPFMMVHQHHPFGFTLPGRKLSYFTVLRDPVSQMRSGYFKRISSTGIVPTRDRSATFEDHIDHTIKNGMRNMLARQIVTTHPEIRDKYKRKFKTAGGYFAIAAEEDMFWLEATSGLSDDRLLKLCRETLDEQFHMVGTMNHLAASHLAGIAGTGVPVAERVGHRGKSGQPEQADEPESETRLREANGVDQQLFEEYTARFEKDYADLIAVVEAE